MNQSTPRIRRPRLAIAFGTLTALTLVSPVLAARPTTTLVDFSMFEPFAEADWTAECEFPVDVEFEGHIVIHEFDGTRLVSINNWQTYQSYSANGKTFVAPRTAGPDILWLAGDGTTYQAIVGRSPSDGLIGRLVRNDDTGAVVSSHGRRIDNPFDDVCDAIDG